MSSGTLKHDIASPRLTNEEELRNVKSCPQFSKIVGNDLHFIAIRRRL
jgi:hypothetical protein